MTPGGDGAEAQDPVQDPVQPPDPDASPAAPGYKLAAILFCLGVVALALPWLTGVVTIPWDAKGEAYPQLAFLARSLAAGDSPFWTPNIYAGHPQIADPQSLIFSPPYLLLALFNPTPSFIAADAIVFLMLVLAGLAVVLLFRDRGWRAEGALVAAFAFSFGGSAAWRLQHIGEVISLCWFAMAFLCLSRALERSSWRYGLATGVVAGFMALGRDQIAYLCALLLAIFVAWRVFDGAGALARLRSAVAPLAAGVLGGVVVTAVPFMLTLALASQSNRPEIDLAAAGRGSLPPFSLLTALVANLFGTAGPLTKYWGPPYPGAWGPNDLDLARNMAAIYFGATPLVAVVCIGLAGGAFLARHVRFFAVAAAFMALYAVGRYTPFFTLAFVIPGVDLFRRPADATFPLGAMLAILGGYCVHRALVDPPRGWTRAVGPLLVASLYAFCVFIAWDKGRLTQAIFPLITGFLFLGGGLVALAIGPRFVARAPTVAMVALAALMTLDLAVNNHPNESTALPPQTYDPLRLDTRDDTIAVVKKRLAETAAPDRRDRVEFAAINYEWPNVGLVHDFDVDLGFNPLRTKLIADATRAADQVATADQRGFSPLFPSYRSTMADLLGLRLIASGPPLQQIDKNLKRGDFNFVARTKDAFVWENPRALPRVLFATRAMPADFDRMMREGGWPDVDYRDVVLLEKPPQEATTSRAPGHAHLASYRNTEIIVDAYSPEGGYVVLNDIWHPWWFAEVDGAPAEILRANVIFRAVRIPPGGHRVRFVFRPLAGLWKQWFGGAS